MRTARRPAGVARKLDQSARRKLLQADWMTHDAMWFAASVRRSGIDRANLVARAAARASAEIGAQRLCLALGLPGVRSFAGLKRFLREALAAMRTPGMRLGVSFPAHNRMLWKASRCMAHDCAKHLGVIDDFQCHVFERLDAWLEELGITCSAVPAVDGCLMHARGACVREFRFRFPPPRRGGRRAPRSAVRRAGSTA